MEISKMATAAQIRKEGRITVPKSVREELGLSEGDFVVLEINPIENVKE